MCLIYRRNNGTAFVRLCYRTNQRGVHLELTPEQIIEWPKVRCLGRGNAHKTPKSKKRFTVTFKAECAPDAIDDMARYMDARYTIDPENKHVIFWSKRGISQNMIRRAESLGLYEVGT